MQDRNDGFWHQFSGEIDKIFEKYGGISALHDVGYGVYDPSTFEGEMKAILAGKFANKGTSLDDLYRVCGVSANNGLDYLVFVCDPFDLWSDAFILGVFGIEYAQFSKLLPPKKI